MTGTHRPVIPGPVADAVERVSGFRHRSRR